MLVLRKALSVSASTILGILLGSLDPVVAQSREVIPFQTLGFNRSILLEGLNPQFEISVPAPPSGQLDLSQSFVQLRLEPSPALDPGSTVRFRLNGEPAGIATVEEILADPLVRIPLRTLSPEDQFITLSIEPFLYITGNHCQDIPTGNLYTLVGNDSFFQLQPQVPDNTIAGFFQPTYSQVTLVVPTEMTTEQAQSALWLYSLISAEFSERQIPILWQRGGNVQDPEEGTAQVRLDTTQQEIDIQRQGSLLRVAAQPEVVRSLMVQLDRPALVSTGVSISQADPLLDQPGIRSASLDDLGLVNLTQRGIGTMSYPINFDLAELEGRPRDPAFDLRATFTPTNASLQDRFHAQVFFNDTLLQTYDLVGQTQLAETIPLPPLLLRRSNTLDIRFVSIPNEGNCLSSPAEVTVQLRPDSQLTWSEYDQPTYDFNDLPHVFMADGGEVVVDINQPELLASAAYAMGLISRLGKQPLMPEVIEATETNLNNLSGSASWRILAVAPGADLFTSPIRLDGQTFDIFNPLNNQLLLQAQPTEEIGLMQYFSQDRVPTLWLSWWGNDAGAVARLSQSVADPRTLLASQLEGNVATSTNPIPSFTQVQSWDLRGPTLKVAGSGGFNFQLSMQRYRWPIIVLTVLLGGGLVYVLFQQLGRVPTPPSIEDDGPPR
jgi:hypothetical protein